MMSPAVYATLLVIPFVDPGNPGTVPNVPAGATAAQIQTVFRHHETMLYAWRLFTNVDKALRQQLTGAINRMYICALEHPHIGFANVMTLQLTQRLLVTYGPLTAHSIHKNDTYFRKAMDPALPFKAFVTNTPTPVKCPTQPPKL
jgi:hypothetical protein